MIFDFPVSSDVFDELHNYDLFMLPKGIYRAKKIVADNFLYPMYYLKEGNEYIVSTSVYALIHYKKRFIRNPKFQTTHFYRPTFMTVDAEIMRARTEHRRSSMDLTDPDEITELGVKLIQDYITEIENKYPGWIHVLSMGGKDSQNLILAERNERWIVLSGEPNTPLNEKFIAENNIEIERFIGPTNDTDNSLLLEEIMASDCGFDVAHFRYVRDVAKLAEEFDGKIVFWMGTSGDGCFSKNNNHRDIDYYAVHDLHVGTAMGVLHQVFKNILDIPAISPYQSPRFLDELFYRYDPYYVEKSGDVRKKMGEMLHGCPVWYPEENPTPDPWYRDRRDTIEAYVHQLEKEGIPCNRNTLPSGLISFKERIVDYLNQHSQKRRSRLSKVLFPARKSLSQFIPAIRNRRHDIAATEIK